MSLFEKPALAHTRWFSPENLQGLPGAGGTENLGAKGRPCVQLPAGSRQVLAAVRGSGIITRMWVTVDDRSPEMLRGLRIRMTWEDSEDPAVDVPFGDFFGIGLGRTADFESELFSNPEGRSFCCFVPMPFRQAAQIELVNLSGRSLGHLFYDVDVLLGVNHSPEMLYFHAFYREESPNRLGEEYVILPRVEGAGRYLGANIGVRTNPNYGDTWWGEGEVKIRFGDEENPTLCGTGTEDYIGTGWGQGRYAHRTQGCTIADSERGEWAFYRYHTVDPVYFDHGCSVSIQTIGGSAASRVRDMQRNGIPLIPVSLDRPGSSLVHIMRADAPADLSTLDITDAWCNFYRQDNWSSVAYCYLDRAN